MHAFKKCDTLSDAQVYFMFSLPGIGREGDDDFRILPNPLNALINVDDWEKAVHGLGPVITNRVKDVLGTPYRDKAKECQRKP